MYWSGAHSGVSKRAQRAWSARSDHKSWYAHAVRDRLISEAMQEASRFNNVIRALVAVTPLLGLLGTVTGMVEVFRRDGCDRFVKRSSHGCGYFQSDNPDNGRSCGVSVRVDFHQHL